ncbi:MAG TPA: hypothetical protein VHL79_24190 [Ramlibacter sp.]|jgi:hypothetical protein|nr:hypothetical protein [Ramlibacter sp.]
MLRRLVLPTFLFLAFAVGVPLLDRWHACRVPASEACVWAKAYLPLSFGLWAIAGLFAAVILYWVLRMRRGSRGSPRPTSGEGGDP